MANERQFTRSEVAKNDDKDTMLFILHDKVLNVHSFLNEHPGGEEVLLDHRGIDASEDFDDVGHSNDAMELMKKYVVGVLVESEKKNQMPKKGWAAKHGSKDKDAHGLGLPFYLLIAGIALGAVIVFYAF